MTTINRREFLKRTSASAAAMSGWTLGCQKRASAKWSGFNLAMCNESMKGLPWEAQCELVAGAGYKGIEIAPFTLVNHGVSEISSQARKVMRTDLEKNGLSCAGLHWLLVAPPPGLHCTTNDAAVRQRTWAYVAELIDFCSDLGGKVMIFGSPKQRGARDVGIALKEAESRLQEGLAAAAQHAQSRGVQILLESLDHTQTDTLNTLADAVRIVKSINHPAIQTMFDFHNTVDESEPYDVLIKKHFHYIQHVHVQEMDGRHMGTGDGAQNYLKAFQTLKDLAYQKWISLEVFDFSPGAETIARESFSTLQSIQSRLTK